MREQILAKQAKVAFDKLLENYEWEARRKLSLELVVAHIVQAGIPEGEDRKRFVDGLEVHYGRVVRGLGDEGVDLSYDPKKKIGVAKRYAVSISD
jgi:hypothetical protein